MSTMLAGHPQAGFASFSPSQAEPLGGVFKRSDPQLSRRTNRVTASEGLRALSPALDYLRSSTSTSTGLR